MTVVIMHDAIGANVSHLPPGQVAGYTTGIGIVPWSAAEWAAHPGAVRICQDVGASDITADVLDVEFNAATNGEAARWYKSALHSYQTIARAGQRHPAIYTSASNLTPLVNALISGGVTSGPNLWVARWDFNQAAETAAVNAASGPFPICGVQFANGTFYDTSVMSSSWLSQVAHIPPTGTGPFRHEFRGTNSWSSVAGARHTTVAHLQSVSEGAYTDHDRSVIATLHMPAGYPFYTTNP
jgi:hypothetical protein